MKRSDFEKEVELEVVPQEEEDKLESLFAQVKDYPKSVKDMLKNKKSKQIKKAESEYAVPETVDTLREDFQCPVDLGAQCGLVDSQDEECSVCGYTEKPDSFDDPDLTKAKRIKKRNELKEDKERKYERSKVERPGRPSFSKLNWSFKGR
jgi:hypothetical protein